MDDSDPYPALLDIGRAFDNNAMLNLNKGKILFETCTMYMITPLDPNEGDKYNEPINEDAQNSIIENIYQITRAQRGLHRSHRRWGVELEESEGI
jgi:hypothetical protein